MIQAFETQLQVVQRALSEVVLPALTGASGHVIEQLHLSMAAVGFMQQRMPHARRYYRQTVASYLDMAAAIVTLLADHAGADGNGLETFIPRGRALLDSPLAEDADYCRFTGEVRAAISGLVETAQGRGYEAALDALIMDRSGPILLQERIWCLPLGFELRPEDLPAPDWATPA